MLRYVKANGQWYDTLSEIRKGIPMYEVDGMLYSIPEGTEEHYIGVIEEESDTYVEG